MTRIELERMDIQLSIEYTLDDFFASGGMLPEVEGEQSDTVKRLYAEMEENREGAARWEKWTGSRR